MRIRASLPFPCLHFLPELLGWFAVDRLQRLDGAEDLGVTSGLKSHRSSLRGMSFQRRQVGTPCVSSQFRVRQWLPFSGDRSDTCVCRSTGPSASCPSAATGRTPACLAGQVSASCPSAATGRTPACHAVQFRQLHVLQRRQVGYLRVCSQVVSFMSFSGDRSDTGVPRSSGRQRHVLQRRQVGHLRVYHSSGRQLHVLQRRQVGHLRVSQFRVRQLHVLQRRQVSELSFL